MAQTSPAAGEFNPPQRPASPVAPLARGGTSTNHEQGSDVFSRPWQPTRSKALTPEALRQETNTHSRSAHRKELGRGGDAGTLGLGAIKAHHQAYGGEEQEASVTMWLSLDAVTGKSEGLAQGGVPINSNSQTFAKSSVDFRLPGSERGDERREDERREDDRREDERREDSGRKGGVTEGESLWDRYPFALNLDTYPCGIGIPRSPVLRSHICAGQRVVCVRARVCVCM